MKTDGSPLLGGTGTETKGNLAIASPGAVGGRDAARREGVGDGAVGERCGDVLSMWGVLGAVVSGSP